MIIQWTEIWRIRWPFVFFQRTRAFLGDYFFGAPCTKTSRHCTRYSTRKLDCTNARHILVCNVRNTQSSPLYLAMMRPPLAALIVCCVACRTLTQLSLCSCCGTFSRTLDPCLAYFRELHATMLSQHLCLNFQDTVH